MLKRLKINNYALIDSIEISFDKGMTSITGETGAGKSIILGGLSMVLGSRIDNSKIINKNKKCFVESEFDLGDQNLEEFFKTNDLDYEDITIIRREVNESGKSRAFINDTPVKLDLLSSLTNKLIDVHSQFNNLSILDSNFIFLILDSLSNNHDEFWATLTGFFKKTKIENFSEIKNELIEIHPEFNTLCDLLELITISGGDLFDLKDEFDLGDTIIEGMEDNEFINLENYGKFNLEGDNSIWIFELPKYFIS